MTAEKNEFCETSPLSTLFSTNAWPGAPFHGAPASLLLIFKEIVYRSVVVAATTDVFMK
jgi:hypothetical protein